MNKAEQKLTLDGPATYQIKVPGEVNERWSDWVAGMTLAVESRGPSVPKSWMKTFESVPPRFWSPVLTHIV